MPNILKDFYSKDNFLQWKGKNDKEKEENMNTLMSRNDVKNYFATIGSALACNLQYVGVLENCIAIFLALDDKVNGKKCWDQYMTFPEKLMIGKRVVWERKKSFSPFVDKNTPEENKEALE